jgi:tetratricopeptide (TPR) repeat protein
VGIAYTDAGDSANAEVEFKESIRHNPHNVKAMLGIAQLCRQAGELDLCIQQCQKIISAVPSNEQATIMLSEVLFMAPNADPAGAILPLSSLLKKHPNNYKALSNMISLFRRAGKLEEVPAFILAAESKVYLNICMCYYIYTYIYIYIYLYISCTT